MFPENASLLCSGFCRQCQTVHSLPSAEAMTYCYAWMDDLRNSGRLDSHLPESQADPALSTATLYSEMRGKMFGILVCEDAQGETVVLRAFSSKFNGFRTLEGWAPPLVDATAYDAAIEAGNTLIHPLTDTLATLQKNTPEWRRLREERRRVSQGVLETLYALYEVHNFRGERRSLAEAVGKPTGIPTGTGDCCAPKLLNYAAKNKLRPRSIAEFFWGKETLSGDRTEGHFYAPCMDKCEPLLGFMLCGSSD